MSCPAAGSAPSRMAASQDQEAGLVGEDAYVHAAERALLGHRAVCGAGRITALLAGPFTPDDRLACPACAELCEEARPRETTHETRGRAGGGAQL